MDNIETLQILVEWFVAIMWDVALMVLACTAAVAAVLWTYRFALQVFA